MSINAKVRSAASATVLLLAILTGCSGENGGNTGNPENGNEPREGTPSPVTGPETTAEGPPKITLGEEPGGRPEVVLRLEGGEETTFSGICSVGDEQSVLSGRVPKRFTFNPRGRELSCRIEKRDEGRGALKIVLVAGNTTRSIQQTNAPNSAINVTYKG